MQLKRITQEVCRIAEQAGSFVKKEREHFSPDKIEQKCRHDYVSYVDKETESCGIMLPAL